MQSCLQGGTFVFKGRDLLWAHKDRAPGDYPDLRDILTAVEKAVGPVAAGAAATAGAGAPSVVSTAGSGAAPAAPSTAGGGKPAVASVADAPSGPQ
jgi:hypothetical protein